MYMFVWASHTQKYIHAQLAYLGAASSFFQYAVAASVMARIQLVAVASSGAWKLDFDCVVCANLLNRRRLHAIISNLSLRTHRMA